MRRTTLLSNLDVLEKRQGLEGLAKVTAEVPYICEMPVIIFINRSEYKTLPYEL
jgi:hypothetical protein